MMVFLSSSPIRNLGTSVHALNVNGNPMAHSTSSSPLATTFQSKIRGQLIFAPLTRGGNLPFRRLCADFGMEVSYSEMVYSRFLVKGDRVEATRMRRPENERYFGVQIATNQVDEGVKAIQMAHEAGADFVDLNCGCPIYEATRRGLGSSLLRSPAKLERLVRGMVEQTSDLLPLTVKIRLGCSEDSINVRDVVDRMRQAGAAAVTIHARTARQGYRKAADWEAIKTVVDDGKAQGSCMPIIGNGDIITHFDATERMHATGVDACMVGRGALIKPWIFQEFKDRKQWEPTLTDRIDVYYKLTTYMKDYFGSDELGRKKSWNFLPWHFSFFSRYQSYPVSSCEEESFLAVPLIHRRRDLPQDATSPLEILLHHRSEKMHEKIAFALWDSDSCNDAVRRLCELSESGQFREIQEQCENNKSQGEDTKELANIPERSKPNQWKGRKRRQRRDPKPDRTPEEIAAIRVERAAKKAMFEAEQNAWQSKVANEKQTYSASNATLVVSENET